MSEMLRSVVLSFSDFDRSTPTHVCHTTFHTPYSVLVRSNISTSQSSISLSLLNMVWLLLGKGDPVFSAWFLTWDYLSKSSYAWKLSSLEHFYLLNHYLNVSETRMTSLSLTCYYAFGTFSCLMFQMKFRKPCNVFKHQGNGAAGELSYLDYTDIWLVIPRWDWSVFAAWFWMDLCFASCWTSWNIYIILPSAWQRYPIEPCPQDSINSSQHIS